MSFNIHNLTSIDAKEMYWKHYLPKFGVIIVLFGGFLAVVAYFMSGLYASEVVPVSKSGAVYYAVSCKYSSVLRIYDVLIEPVVVDGTQLDKNACPKSVARALRMQIKDNDAKS